MTKLQLLRKYQQAKKALDKLWQDLEFLEDDIDEQGVPTGGLSTWDVSEMQESLQRGVNDLESAIKLLKRAK